MLDTMTVAQLTKNLSTRTRICNLVLDELLGQVLLSIAKDSVTGDYEYSALKKLATSSTRMQYCMQSMSLCSAFQERSRGHVKGQKGAAFLWFSIGKNKKRSTVGSSALRAMRPNCQLQLILRKKINEGRESNAGAVPCHQTDP